MFVINYAVLHISKARLSKILTYPKEKVATEGPNPLPENRALPPV